MNQLVKLHRPTRASMELRRAAQIQTQLNLIKMACKARNRRVKASQHTSEMTAACRARMQTLARSSGQAQVECKALRHQRKVQVRTQVGMAVVDQALQLVQAVGQAGVDHSRMQGVLVGPVMVWADRAPMQELHRALVGPVMVWADRAPMQELHRALVGAVMVWVDRDPMLELPRVLLALGASQGRTRVLHRAREGSEGARELQQALHPRQIPALMAIPMEAALVKRAVKATACRAQCHMALRLTSPRSVSASPAN